MGAFGLINHLLNFILPALVLALMLPLCACWMPMARATPLRLSRSVLVLTLVNITVLLAGLLLFGRDGKMVTYLTMAVASATTQWLLLKAWRS